MQKMSNADPRIFGHQTFATPFQSVKNCITRITFISSKLFTYFTGMKAPWVTNIKLNQNK